MPTAQTIGILGAGLMGAGIAQVCCCDAGLGFGVWGLGFGVWGLGFGVWGLCFGVWGLWFTVCGLCAGEHPEGLQRGAEGQDRGGAWQGRESGCVMCCNVLQPKTRIDLGWLVGGWEPCVDGEEKEDDGSRL